MRKSLFIILTFLLLVSGVLLGCTKSPSNPVLTLAYETNKAGFVFDSDSSGEIRYLATETGVWTLDSSVSTNPKLYFATISPVNDIYISGTTAYLAIGQRRLPNGVLVVLDVSNPTTPTELGKLVLPEGPISVRVKDSTAFIGDFGTGAILVDVSNPSDMKIISTIQVGDEEFSSYEKTLQSILKRFDLPSESALFTFVRNEYPDQTVGKTDDDLRTFITNMGRVGHSWWMTVEDNILYLPYDGEGLYTVDITNKETPVVLDNYKKNCYEDSERCYFNDVAIKDGYAFVAIDFGGLLVLDIKDPTDIKEVAHVRPWPIDTWKNSKGHMIQIDLVNSYAILTAGEDGVYIFDISNPTNPVLMQVSSSESMKEGKGCSWGINATQERVLIGYAPCIATNPIYGAFEIYHFK